MEYHNHDHWAGEAQSTPSETRRLSETQARVLEKFTKHLAYMQLTMTPQSKVQMTGNELEVLIELATPAQSGAAGPEALRARLEQIVREGYHNDTCGAVLSDGVVYPCNCWKSKVLEALQ